MLAGDLSELCPIGLADQLVFITFLIGVYGVMAGIGGEVLFVPLATIFFRFTLILYVVLVFSLHSAVHQRLLLACSKKSGQFETRHAFRYGWSNLCDYLSLSVPLAFCVKSSLYSE